MENYLSDVFGQSEDTLARALTTIVGEGQDDDTILKELLDAVPQLGVDGLVSDYDSDVSKV